MKYEIIFISDKVFVKLLLLANCIGVWESGMGCYMNSVWGPSYVIQTTSLFSLPREFSYRWSTSKYEICKWISEHTEDTVLSPYLSADYAC